MGRPTKQTADYFPHACVHKKTIYVIEQRYGNDGYAFWFKLLELLGSSEGHYYDLRDAANMEFLMAKTRTDESTCTEILNMLARLDAIDKDLWEQHQVVWSQNFVDGLDPLYKKRSTEKPSKPSFRNENPGEDSISGEKTPQSRVEKSKVKESIKESIGAVPFQGIVDSFNLHCPSLPRVTYLTNKQRKALSARWKVLNTIDQWNHLFMRAEASDFLTGRSNRWKGCTFDWLIQEANITKLFKGAHDIGGSGHEIGFIHVHGIKMESPTPVLSQYIGTVYQRHRTLNKAIVPIIVSHALGADNRNLDLISAIVFDLTSIGFHPARSSLLNHLLIQGLLKDGCKL